MSGAELSLLDVDAIHAQQCAEWIDGINTLRKQGKAMTKETMDLVKVGCESYRLDEKVLAELSLKVRLLDITGDGVDIPEKLSFGPAPASTDFWFAR